MGDTSKFGFKYADTPTFVGTPCNVKSVPKKYNLVIEPLYCLGTIFLLPSNDTPPIVFVAANFVAVAEFPVVKLLVVYYYAVACVISDVSSNDMPPILVI